MYEIIDNSLKQKWYEKFRIIKAQIDLGEIYFLLIITIILYL